MRKKINWMTIIVQDFVEFYHILRIWENS
jgi:hypothetical protein